MPPASITKDDLRNDLAALEKRIKDHIDMKVEPICERVENVEASLWGGSHPSNGIPIRLDRLEQNQERNRRSIHSLFGGFLATIGSTIAAILIHRAK